MLDIVAADFRFVARLEEEAAPKSVAAFRELLPAVERLVSSHFRRVLLETAEGRLEGVEP